MVNGEIIFVYVCVYCVSYCLMIVQPLGGGYDLQTSILWRYAMQPVDVRIVCKQQNY